MQKRAKSRSPEDLNIQWYRRENPIKAREGCTTFVRRLIDLKWKAPILLVVMVVPSDVLVPGGVYHLCSPRVSLGVHHFCMPWCIKNNLSTNSANGDGGDGGALCVMRV